MYWVPCRVMVDDSSPSLNILADALHDYYPPAPPEEHPFVDLIENVDKTPTSDDGEQPA